MRSLEDKMKDLGSERRKKIEKRATALIAEEMTLKELRRARKITQVRVAKALGFDRKVFRGLRNAAIFCCQRYETP